jgi:D-alanine-D-alanine ligase
MGGASTEREVSLASGKNILARLDKERYAVSVFDPAVDLARLVQEAPNLDVAFPALHGAAGEDGSIQGLLSLLNLPFVGSGVLASAICLDKNLTKDVYRKRSLPVIVDRLCARGESVDQLAKDLETSLGLPLVVKPLDQGSSVGLSIAKTSLDIVDALTTAFKFAKEALVEKFVPGRELTVGVLGNERLKALPPVEIIPAQNHEFFDYAAKYTPGEAQEICPASLTPTETAEVQRLAVTAHEALGCRGLSRTDFILSQGTFYLLETNTLPGFTENSLLPKAALAAGLSFTELLSVLIDLAFDLD